jgi:hypothetical protein
LRERCSSVLRCQVLSAGLVVLVVTTDGSE